MYKTAVIGRKGDVFYFAALGVEVFSVESAYEAREMLTQLAQNGGYAVIFVTEEYMQATEDIAGKVEKNTITAVVTVPQMTDGTGLGTLNLDRTIVKAIGSNI